VNRAVADVMAFMRIAGQPVRSSPEIPRDPENATDPVLRLVSAQLDWLACGLRLHASSEKAFRLRLILSEAAELATALVENDLAGVADALADLDYVTIGTAVQFGIPHGAVWDAVQASNLAKFPVCTGCAGDGSLPRTDLVKNKMVSDFMGTTWLVAPLHGGVVAAEFISETEADDFMAKQRIPCEICGGQGRVVVKDAQGKVQKPAGWAPPDIAAILTNAVVEPQERS